MTNKKVLAYGFSPLEQKNNKTALILGALGYGLIFVNSSDEDTLIKELLEREPQSYDEFYLGAFNENSPELLLFATEDTEEIMPAIRTLKRLNAHVDAKGVLTPTNAEWPLKMLTQDMLDEQKYMDLIVDFYAFSKLIQGMDEFKEYEDQLTKIFKGEEPNYDLVLELYEKLKDQYSDITNIPALTGRISFETEPNISEIDTSSSEKIEAELQNIAQAQFNLVAVPKDINVLEESLSFIWNDKAEGATHPATLGEELETLFVTVSSDKAFEKFKEQAPIPLRAPRKLETYKSDEVYKIKWKSTVYRSEDLPALAQELNLYFADGSLKKVFLAPDTEIYELDATKQLIMVEISGHSILGKGDIARVNL